MAKNFLLPTEYDELYKEFRRNVKDLISKVINAQDN